MKGTYEVEMTYNELKRMALKEALADYSATHVYAPCREVIDAFVDAIEKTKEQGVE